jgi:hypothetical protein
MGHCQHHVPPSPIFQPPELGIDPVPSARFFPQVARNDNRHRDLLTTNRLDLIPQNIFDLVQGFPSQRQVAKYPGCELADKASPN